MASDDYPGCSTYVAPSGLAGVVVQRDGKLSGYLWDFFVARQEKAAMAYEMLLLALSQRGKMLATYDHALLISFFERFGFQAMCMVKKGPRNAVHMMLLDDVFKQREPRFRQALATVDATSAFVASDGEHVRCDLCGEGSKAQVLTAEGFGGYECPRCGFIRVHGTLTLGRPENA